MKNILKASMIVMVFIIGMMIGSGLNKNKPIERIEEVKAIESHEEGEKTIITLNNGSWAMYNEKNNIYVFQPVELGDWDIKVKDHKQLENIIKTYISMKNTGTF